METDQTEISEQREVRAAIPNSIKIESSLTEEEKMK